jgi:membrane dipeptidase
LLGPARPTGARPAATTTVDRRQLIRAGIFCGAGTLAGPLLNFGRCRVFADELEISTRAVDLVLGSTVVDMLGLLTLDWLKLGRWQRRPESFGMADFRGLKASGVTVFHPAVAIRSRDPFTAARRWLEGWNGLLANRPCFLARVGDDGGLRRVARQGKIGVVVGLQNSDHFRGPADVAGFRALGQSVSQLTYDGRNRLGSGCKVRQDRGLTPFGAEIVAAMGRAGMAVDVSHCGERTSLDAIAASRQPVLATHSNCRALAPGQRRCKSDAVIRRLAAGGGVIGITVVKAFVGGRSPAVGDLLDHFDHVARLVGVEHVGLGSDVDLDGTGKATGRPLPAYRIRGLHLRRRVFQIAEGLLRRGWTDRQVRLVLGGNFRRALADIWSVVPSAPVPERELRRDPFCPLAPPATVSSLDSGHRERAE